MDPWSIVLTAGLLALALSPLVFAFDAFNLLASAALVALCIFLPFFLSEPFRICLALGPVAIYLLLFGTINLARRPFVVSAARDLAALALAAVGLVAVGPMELFFPLAASIRFGAYVWALMLGLYVLFVVFLILFLRPRLIIYNISIDELRPILADLAGKLDADARWAGDSLWLPSLGVQLHVDSVAKMRNVTLASSGPAQNPQGWRRLELALQAALAQVEVPRNVRAVSLISAAAIILLFLILAVSSDPQNVAQAIVNMFWT
jgi:hypothetical protein